MQIYPEFKIFTIGKLKIGLIHGHQIMPWGDKESIYAFKRDINVDIFIFGHPHIHKLTHIDDRIIHKQGSITESSLLTLSIKIFRTTISSLFLLEFKES